MKVFISHASEDSRAAQELTARLAAAGFEVADPYSNVLPGDNYALQIGRALQKASAMIVLVSPAAMESPFVQQDIDYALGSLQYQDRLLPVSVRQTSQLPWSLKALPQFELGKDPDETARQIIRYLRRKPADATR